MSPHLKGSFLLYMHLLMWARFSSSFSGFTADQWRNWTAIFSSVALKGILPPAHLRCWLLFVRACTILCTRLINVNRLYALFRRSHVYRKALFWKEGGHVLWPCDSKRHSFDRSDFCYRQLVTKAKSDPSAVQQH